MPRVSGSHAEAQNAVSAAARTLAYGGTLTSASLLTVFVSTYNTGVTVTVSDGTNGAYTQAGAYSDATDTNIRVSLWYKANNTATSAPTVTVTPSASAYVSLSIDEWTGVATSSPLLATATGTGTVAAHVTPTVTALAGDLVVAGVGSGTTLTVDSVTAPFTLLTMLVSSGSFEGIHTAYHLTATGNEAATFNFASDTSLATNIIASFLPLTTPSSLRVGPITRTRRAGHSVSSPGGYF